MTTEKFYEIAKQAAGKYKQIKIDLHEEYTLGVNAYGIKMVIAFADDGQNIECESFGPLNGLTKEQKLEVCNFVTVVQKAAG